ncbi:hypothetical protein SteCoe_33940 [Stentor coeruleus]|uniref:Uncharacterized protein n=1 Tax=Stentor coeruleus TaxID=5963 RepID=A0A1R2AVT8_9CILI|nr:hypothetical protein SteCoe_33940 [Stentor coeruleus]
MLERKKCEGSKYLKPEFYKDQSSFDPMITFQPRTAPIMQFPPPKPNGPFSDLKKERQISSKAYFQEFTRKLNNQKSLPPLNGLSSSSRSAFPSQIQGTSKVCLKSDSIASKSNIKQVVEAMSITSYTVEKNKEDYYRENIQRFRKQASIIQRKIDTPKLKITTKDQDEQGQVKTPTFKSSDDKVEVMKDIHTKIENNSSGKFKDSINSEGLSMQRYSKNIIKISDSRVPKLYSNIITSENHSDPNKNQHDKLNAYMMEDIVKKQSSSSKTSAIESSVSTDFPFTSPVKVQEKVFFNSYVGKKLRNPDESVSARKESPLKIRKDHPKIKVRSGFPRDIFTYKQ